MKFVKFRRTGDGRPIWLNADRVRIVAVPAASSSCALCCGLPDSDQCWRVDGDVLAVAAAPEAAKRIGAGSDNRTSVLPALTDHGVVFGRMPAPDDTVAVGPAEWLASNGARSVVVWDNCGIFAMDTPPSSPETAVEVLEGRA